MSDFWRSVGAEEYKIVKRQFQIVCVALSLGLAGFLLVQVAAEPAASSKTDAAGELQSSIGNISGSGEFQRYCALCHGGDGRGAGPLTDADAMKKSAADLTQITKRNGGVFPFSKVADTIRDGGSIAEHSPSRMMAWGKIFSAESDLARANAIIFEVTRYVEGLQEK
jgi:mono/diheme cytochrome c family protein